MLRKRIIPLLCGVLLCMPVLAFAQTPTQNATPPPLITEANTGLAAAAKGTGLEAGCKGEVCIVSIASAVINILFSIVGILLLLLLLYAGFLWMTAQGDMEKVKKARETIINAAFGLVIMVAAYAVATYVIQQLTFAVANEDVDGPAIIEDQPAPRNQPDPDFDAMQLQGKGINP